MTSFHRITIGCFFFIVLGLLVLLSFRGVVYSDEGYILFGAQRMVYGQIPYKDFHFVYTPFSLYATVLSFIIFGKSILAGRLLMIGVSLLSGGILYLLLRKVSKNIWISLLGVLLYVVWAPLHTNFPWPVLFAIPLGIISCYFLLLGEESKSKKLLFVSGFFTFLVLFTKQNFGVAMMVTYLVALFCMPVLRKKDLLRFYLLGVIIPGLVYTLYLYFSGSFIPFFTDLYVYTFQRIVIEQTLTTPFILGETLVEKAAKFIFYTLPFIVGGIASYICFLKSKKHLFLSAFVCLFYLVGIRPTTDYIHLTPLLSLLGIPVSLLWETSRELKIKIAMVSFLVFFIGIGIYSALYRGYYKWEPPLIIQNKLLSVPKTHIFLDSFHKDQLEKIYTIISTTSQENEPIFVNGYIPLLYFITNRQNPTPFDLLEPTDFYVSQEKDVVGMLKNKTVKIVITRNDPLTNYLGEYIKREYNKSAKVNDFIIWRKKSL